MEVALTPVRIPQLQQREPIVDKDGRMSNEFARRLNEILGSLATSLNAIRALPAIQQALEDAQALIEGLGDATEAANAQTAAIKREAALQGSYIDPDAVLTADPTTITIAPHTRYYGDGTSKPVNGGTIAATASGDVDYISYSDPARAGGTVTFVVSTTPPTQTGDVHVVGAVMIPATGTVDGGEGPRRPGYVSPRLQDEVNEP